MNTYNYICIYTILNSYVRYNYASLNTKVYLHLYKMDTYNYKFFILIYYSYNYKNNLYSNTCYYTILITYN